jgi:hypothetical protein
LKEQPIDQKNPAAGMERHAQVQHLSHLSDSFVRWASISAAETDPASIKSVLGFLRALPEDSYRLVGKIVGNFHKMMRTTEGLIVCLPDFYTAQVGSSQLVRSYAATAMGEMRGTTHDNLPSLGQRTLLLEGLDLARQPLTGYRHVDQKLIDIRNELRVAPGMVQQELTEALGLLIPLANLAAQSVNDNVFDTALSEDEFQKRVRFTLRSQPNIGSALEEDVSSEGVSEREIWGRRSELCVRQPLRSIDHRRNRRCAVSGCISCHDG